MMRKEAITEWLQKCASRSIKKEVEESDGTSKSNKHVESVLSLLSGKEIKEACSRLQKVGEEKKKLTFYLNDIILCIDFQNF